MLPPKAQLIDIVSPVVLQRLQDGFACMEEMAVVIVGPQGNLLTQPSVGEHVCYCAQFAPDRTFCNELFAELCIENAETGRVAMRLCPQTRLPIVAVPITKQKQYLGSWILNRFRLCTYGESYVYSLARDLGESVELLQDFLERVPLISPEKLEYICSYLHHLSELFFVVDFSLQMLDEILNTCDTGMCASDYETGEILLVNESYAQQMGFLKEELIGKKSWEVGSIRKKNYRPETSLDDVEKSSGAYRWIHYNEKHKKWVRSSHQAMQWMDGRVVHLATQLDVSEEHAMREELTRIAYYDPILNLPNNTKLMQDLKKLTLDDERESFLVGLNLGGTRQLTHVYGRETADSLLREVANWLQGVCGKGDTLYRVGKDEFCILICGGEKEEAENVAEKIYARFSGAWQLVVGNETLSYVCGAAVALLWNEQIKCDEAMALLERTLEASRYTGGVAIYDKEIDMTVQRKETLQVLLKHCMQENMDGFEVHYQPIVDVSSGLWVGVEALCRWNAPSFDWVPPLEFIRIAEQQGHINKLGMWVLQTAVCHCKDLKLDTVEGFFLSVNISAIQIMNEQFSGQVAEMLKKHNYPGNKLNLEITESSQFAFNSFTLSVLQQLQEMGITLAIDDFGTGYSSLLNLRTLPVHYVKTEREFIKGIEENSYMQYFLYVLSELTHASGRKLVAEGVETQEQLQIVRKNGADYVQGYYFSRPLPADVLQKKRSSFLLPKEMMPPPEAKTLDIKEWLSGKVAHTTAPVLFRLTYEYMNVLTGEPSMFAAFNRVLEMMGEQYRARRTFVFLDPNRFGDNSLYEWCAEGTSGKKHLLTAEVYARLVKELMPTIQGSGIIVSDCEALQPQIIRAFEVENGCALAALPLWQNGELLGVVGVADRRGRQWTADDVIMLQNLVVLFESRLLKETLRYELKQKNRTLYDVLNNAGMNAFVEDVETGEILWANQTLRQRYRIGEQLVGRKCYEIIQGRSERCSFCSVPKLLESPENTQIVFEHYNTVYDKYFTVYDSLIHWDDGRVVHLECSIDITDCKKAQEMLGTYNNFTLQEEAEVLRPSNTTVP